MTYLLDMRAAASRFMLGVAKPVVYMQGRLDTQPKYEGALGETCPPES